MKKIIKQIVNHLFFLNSFEDLLQELIIEKNNISLQFCEKCRVNFYCDKELLTKYTILFNQIKRLEKIIETKQ